MGSPGLLPTTTTPTHHHTNTTPPHHHHHTNTTTPTHHPTTPDHQQHYGEGCGPVPAREERGAGGVPYRHGSTLDSQEDDPEHQPQRGGGQGGRPVDPLLQG